MARYVAIGEQSNLATEATPDKYIRIASVETSPESGNIYAELVDTRFDEPPIAGAFRVSGSIVLPVELENIGYLLKALLGNVSSSTIDSTASIHEHIISPIDFGGSLPAYTIAIGKDNVTDERLVGAVFNRLTLRAVAKELLSATFEFGGVKSKTTSLLTPSLPSPDFVPYYKGDVIVDGSADGNIEAFTITVSNGVNYDDAYRITSTNGRLPKEFPIGAFKVEVEFDARFVDTTYIEAFYGATDATEPQESIKTLSVKLSFVGKTLELSAGGTTHQALDIYLPKVIVDSVSVPIRDRGRLVLSASGTAVKGTASVTKYDGSTVDVEAPIAIYLRNQKSSL